MRYLSIDYGNKNTGLAICDSTETFVSPLMAIPTSDTMIGRIIEVVKAENVGSIVLGLPLNMDDSVGPQAKKVQLFADQLEKHVGVPVIFQDERLSTFAAKDKMIAMDLTHKGKKRRIDAIAAAEILQSFLDSKKASKNT
jgi:putative Holliday junction resolvase